MSDPRFSMTSYNYGGGGSGNNYDGYYDGGGGGGGGMGAISPSPQGYGIDLQHQQQQSPRRRSSSRRLSGNMSSPPPPPPPSSAPPPMGSDWPRVGDVCRLNGADGGDYTARVVALGPGTVTTVLLVDFDTEVDVNSSALSPLTQLARAPSGRRKSLYREQQSQSRIAPPRGSFQPSNMTLKQEQQQQQQQQHFFPTSPSAGKIGEVEMNEAYRNQGNAPLADYPGTNVAETSFAQAGGGAGTGNLSSSSLLRRRAKDTVLPPGYEKPPPFDHPESVSLHWRRLSALSYARSDRSKDGLLTHGTSVYDVAMANTMRRRRSTIGAPNSRNERKRLETAHKTGIFTDPVDLLPVENPDPREAFFDVNTHTMLADLARHAPVRLHDRIGEYREERDIVSMQRVYMSYYDQFKLWIWEKWQALYTSIQRTINDYRLWNSSILRIESKFGTAFSAYFGFVRYLFGLNFFIALLYIVFLVVPQAVKFPGASNLVPPAPANASQGFYAFVGGEEPWDETLLFYGVYSDQQPVYSVAQAYIVLAGVFVVLTLLIVTQSLASNFRRNAQFIKGGVSTPFAVRTLCSWDFSIYNERSIERARNSNSFALLDMLAANARLQKKLRSAVKNKRELLRRQSSRGATSTHEFSAHRLFLIRTALLVLYLGLTGGICYGIYEMSIAYTIGQAMDANLTILTPLTITLINYVLPYCIGLITRFEFWEEDETSYQVNTVRILVSRLAIMGTYLGVFYTFVTPENTPCWETRYGQETYRLYMLDVLVGAAMQLILFVTQKVLARTRWAMKFKFPIPFLTIDLICRQGIVWAGQFFCPFMSIIAALHLIVIFFTHKYYTLLCCAINHNFHLVSAPVTAKWMLLAVFGATIIPMGYITFMRTPGTCGPYAGLESWYEQLDRAALATDDSLWIEVWKGVFSPGLCVPILFILLIFIAYNRHSANAKRLTINELRHWLQLERIDMKQLLRMKRIVT